MTDPTRTREVALKSVDGFLAFGFGSGLAPFAPGTAGSLVAVPLALPLVFLPVPAALGLVFAAFAFGIWLCGRVGRRLGVHDHSGIVFDEFVGLWLVLIFVPLHWAWWLAAFVLFRIFDAAKPWPIGWFDRRIHGGLGVMLDDLLAAGFALAGLALAAALLGRL
ncbi:MULTISPECIES: phosphatidylglycerophosphatase A [unclassified Wenzhouxiangella]|uniref:phosphatidylglycerophosphatase A family protein n=1 Tax=unclassified Wenzhouxiangella TaxID=2613841 RepID=UPI000E32C71A|nr:MULTISPECIES: phosphatidylglycerophosphatase A [unclassified Wenzhouxiangella]RFF26425.1 phosphatidylglycerophosphatase A [Wenzhouxiangella sp. 15181]RFP67302.1 phosphatidylglycerophosphatase A [Wenzhouxiangella sp. 15190]